MNIINSFPGYEFIPFGEDGKPHNIYRGEDVGLGGYVHAEPGIYSNVALLDVASLHPTSIILLNLFGPYTERYEELLEARLAIKRRDFDAARKMLDGKLASYLQDEDEAKDLSYALKIALNIVFGLTCASFPNAFRDNRNRNNIVALRGALFMVDLKNAVQNEGFQVIHIKTDSIKIPNATEEIVSFVVELGRKYGYTFEHEATYDWFCLANDAVYVAREDDKWTAVGAQFQHSYVFKTLFTHEDLVFDDFCETKNVQQGTMYLDFSGTGEVDKMVHVGRTGSFMPVTNGGGDLVRIKDDKQYAVTGTKGWKWINRDAASDRDNMDSLNIDMAYFEKLKQDAIDAITQFDEVHGLDAIMALSND